MPAPSRASDHITVDQASDLIQATAFAEVELRRPLNMLITIHLASADPPGRLEEQRGRLLKLFQQWLAKHRHRWHAVWVVENHGDTGRHLHVLAHIPEERQDGLKERITRWIEKQLKGEPDRNTVHVRRVWVDDAGRMDHGGIGYLLKALHASPMMRTTIKVNGESKTYLDSLADLINGPPERQHARAIKRQKYTGRWLPLWIPNKGSQGQIVGKRCGTSEAIGQKARDNYWAQRQVTRPATPIQPARPDQAVA